MKIFMFYLFLLVITDPYKGINYNEINVYKVNYCSNYCDNQNDDNYTYFDEEDEIEEIDEWEYEIKEEYQYEDKPLIFDLDTWLKKK